MVKVLAHRGGVGGTNITENTIDAFKRAFCLEKINGIECDLRKMKSGDIVIFHDSYFVNNGKEFHLSEMTLKQAKNIRSDICTLSDLLTTAINYKYEGLLNLEIKEYDIVKDVCRIIEENEKNYPLNILITSFLHLEVSEAFTYFNKGEFNKCISFGLIYRAFPLTYIDLLNDRTYNLILSMQVIPFHRKQVMDELCKNAKNVYIYTVNEHTEMQKLIDLGINIITDFPNIIEH